MPLDALLHRFASYSGRAPAESQPASRSGFELAPTFGRPHFTVTMAGPDEASALLDPLGKAEQNPYRERRPGRS